MTYTTLREAGGYVRRKAEFTGSNVYGRWHSTDADHLPERHRRYVVYSYGSHFPMYIFDEDTEQWFGNLDKYSSTTSRHQSACHPPNIHVWYDTAMMQKIAMWGVIPVTAARVTDSITLIGVARDAA